MSIKKLLIVTAILLAMSSAVLMYCVHLKLSRNQGKQQKIKGIFSDPIEKADPNKIHYDTLYIKAFNQKS